MSKDKPTSNVICLVTACEKIRSDYRKPLKMRDHAGVVSAYSWEQYVAQSDANELKTAPEQKVAKKQRSSNKS